MMANLFPDFFEPDVLVTPIYKKEMNLRIVDKLNYLLDESKGIYLENYWYSLKYTVQTLHGIY